jgi:hypothetical protein
MVAECNEGKLDTCPRECHRQLQPDFVMLLEIVTMSQRPFQLGIPATIRKRKTATRSIGELVFWVALGVDSILMKFASEHNPSHEGKCFLRQSCGIHIVHEEAGGG